MTEVFSGSALTGPRNIFGAEGAISFGACTRSSNPEAFNIGDGDRVTGVTNPGGGGGLASPGGVVGAGDGYP